MVLAPHIASASSDTRLKMANLAVDNCLAVLEGKTPPTPVNPEVLAKRAEPGAPGARDQGAARAAWTAARAVMERVHHRAGAR